MDALKEHKPNKTLLIVNIRNKKLQRDLERLNRFISGAWTKRLKNKVKRVCEII